MTDADPTRHPEFLLAWVCQSRGRLRRASHQGSVRLRKTHRNGRSSGRTGSGFLLPWLGAALMDSMPVGLSPIRTKPGNFAWELVVLGLLPLVLLCFDRNWIFPSMIHDPWIYLGFALDPWRMLSKLQGGYYSERLSLLLPLAAAHASFPPWRHTYWFTCRFTT